MVNNSTMPTYSDYFAESANRSTLQVNETISKISELGPATLGTRHLAGIMILGIIIFALYKFKAGLDVWFSITPATIFILAEFGYLPLANTLMTLSLLSIAGMLTYGISQYF